MTSAEMLPVEPACGADGKPGARDHRDPHRDDSRPRLAITVGRCMLLLLDSDVEGNLPEDRALTARLYGGDRRVRIRQELLLGVGGFRALRELGITPAWFT